MPGAIALWHWLFLYNEKLWQLNLSNLKGRTWRFIWATCRTTEYNKRPTGKSSQSTRGSWDDGTRNGNAPVSLFFFSRLLEWNLVLVLHEYTHTQSTSESRLGCLRAAYRRLRWLTCTAIYFPFKFHPDHPTTPLPLDWLAGYFRLMPLMPLGKRAPLLPMLIYPEWYSIIDTRVASWSIDPRDNPTIASRTSYAQVDGCIPSGPWHSDDNSNPSAQQSTSPIATLAATGTFDAYHIISPF